MDFAKLVTTTVGVTAFALISVTSVWADNIAQARSLVDAFYTKLADEDYNAAIDMFLPDAKAVSVYNFGKAYPEETVAYSPKDIKQYIEAEIPEEYQQYFEGYKETDQSFKVLGAKAEGDAVTVTGRMTTDYEMSGYSGKIIQNDTFTVVFPSADKPAFSSYRGVTTYK